MRMKALIITGTLIAGIGPGVRPAAAEHPGYLWDHPCTDNPGSTLTCPAPEQQQMFGFLPDPEEPTCWCTGEWNNPDHWDGLPGYPDDPDEDVRIEHSNTGFCSGGSDAGEACSDDDQCEWRNCANVEDHLALGLSTETVHALNIASLDTAAWDDKLALHFVSDRCSGGDNDGKPCETVMDCPGSNTSCVPTAATLTTLCVSLWAVEGPVTMKVTQSAAVRCWTGLRLDAATGDVSITVEDAGTFTTDP